jgi:hypothetical protein
MSKRFEELLLKTEAELLSRQLLGENPNYPRDELRIAQLEMAFVEQSQDHKRPRTASARSRAGKSTRRRVVDLLIGRLARS